MTGRLSLRLAVTSCSMALVAVAGTASAAEADAPIVVVSDWSARGEVVYATCPEGTTLVGGGYNSNPDHLNSGAIADAVNANLPSGSRPNAWAIRMDRGQAQAYAMCSKDSDQPPTVVVSDWSARGEVAYATCPEGTTLAGGGYDSRPDHLNSGPIADAVNANLPSGSKPNTWAVRMDRGQAQAYAMCAK